MKSLLFCAAVVVSAMSSPTYASPDLASKKNCMSCHRTTERQGPFPSYKEVAAKYAGQKDAVDKLAQKIVKGGSGSWGAVPMPANPHVSEAEAKQLAAWILTVK